MTVMGLFIVYVKLELGKGIEFDIPLTSSTNLEIGCGGKTIKDDAYCEFISPKLRLWIVRKDTKNTSSSSAAASTCSSTSSSSSISMNKNENSTSLVVRMLYLFYIAMWIGVMVTL